MESHTRKTVKRSKCNGCKKSFANRDDYESHIKACLPSMVDINHDSSVDFTAVTNISTESSPTYLSMVVINEDTNNVTQTSPFKLVENSQNCSTEDCDNEDHEKDPEVLIILNSPDELVLNDRNDFGNVETETSLDLLDSDNDGYAEEDENNNQVLNDEDVIRFKDELVESTKRCIKTQLRLARYRIKQKAKVARFIIDFFDEKLAERSFFVWLGRELSIGGEKQFKDFLSYATKDKYYGYAKYHVNLTISFDLRVKVYEYWKNNSIISVDRRNDLYKIRTSKKKISNLAKDIIDDDVNSVVTKRGVKLEARRYIYTKPVRTLHSAFIDGNDYISLGTFWSLKPFYICTI